jgi:glucose/arabinose dehydrogenase
MDITPAYSVPNLKQAIRTMHYSRTNDGSVELADQFDIAGPADIVESIPTHGTMKQIDAKTLQIDYQGEQLRITIDAPSTFTITQDKVDDMGNPFTRIGATMHLDKSAKVVMHFKPASAN